MQLFKLQMGNANYGNNTEEDHFIISKLKGEFSVLKHFDVKTGNLIFFFSPCTDRQKLSSF